MAFKPAPVAPTTPATPDQLHTLLIGLQKGGTGKSSAAASIAHALARLGLGVLLVDFAPNHILTKTILGFDPEPDEGEATPTVADLISGSVANGDAAEYMMYAPDQWQPNEDIPWDKGGAYRPGGAVWFIPGSSRLQEEADNDARAGADLRLMKALAGVARQISVVIIDTDPSAGRVARMAMQASGWALAPAVPESGAVDGIEHQFAVLNDFAAATAHPIKAIGVLCQRVERSQTRVHGSSLAEMWTMLEEQPSKLATRLEIVEDVPGGPVRRGALYPQLIFASAQVGHAQMSRSPLTVRHPKSTALTNAYAQAALRTLQLMESDALAELVVAFEKDPLLQVWPLPPDDSQPRMRDLDG